MRFRSSSVTDSHLFHLDTEYRLERIRIRNNAFNLKNNWHGRMTANFCIANYCKGLLFFFTFDVNRFTIKCCSSNDLLIKNSYTKNCFWRRGIADVQSGPLGTDCGKLSRRCHGAGSRRTSSGTPSSSSGSSGPGQTFNFSTIKREKGQIDFETL